MTVSPATKPLRSGHPSSGGRGEHDTVIPRQAIARTQSWMAAHTSEQSVVYRGLGHDVAGREVPDFAAFVARQCLTGAANPAASADS